MADVRFGVIGLRRGRSFVRVCNAVGGAAVTALFDIDRARVERAAAEIGARAFTTLEDFLAADVDAVVIASPLPVHAEQAIAALGAGKHVLSEVTSCATLDQARDLVRAAQASDAIYMLAENYRYLDEVELIKRLYDGGRFGDVYYGEGEYIHDCRELWYNDDGSLTWRGRGGLGVYGTHSLGPLLYITGDRVTMVSALAVPGGKFDPAVTRPTMHSLHCATAGGALFRIRVDHTSPRPGRHAFYAIQGTHGCYESHHGFGDTSKVWLDDEHAPSRYSAPAHWHALSEQSPGVIPERLAAPPEARSGGHQTSEYWMLKDFLAAVRGEMPAPIDIYRALDYTLPGICAVESAEWCGSPVVVPDPRDPAFIG